MKSLTEELEINGFSWKPAKFDDDGDVVRKSKLTLDFAFRGKKGTKIGEFLGDVGGGLLKLSLKPEKDSGVKPFEGLFSLTKGNWVPPRDEGSPPTFALQVACADPEATMKRLMAWRIDLSLKSITDVRVTMKPHDPRLPGA